jgi:hypothetical protein
MNKVLAYIGREAAQIAAILSGAIQLIAALGLGLTVDQQGSLNALIVIVLGILTALAVNAEKAAPLIAGFVQALMSVALSFGFHLSVQVQSSVMVFVAAVVAIWLRSIVTAPVGPDAVSSAQHAA